MALWGAPSGNLAPDPLAGKRLREKVAIIPGESLVSQIDFGRPKKSN
jgi:hypothetical protein